MSATPTARPWTVVTIRRTEHGPISYIKADSGHREVAVLYGDEDDANARLIVTAVNHHAELIATVRELRDACAAAMRVVADCDTLHLAGADAETRQQRFVDELHLAGVTDGFGKRADDLLARLDGAEREQG